MNTMQPADPRDAQRRDPQSGMSDDPRVDPAPHARQTPGPSADDAMENESPGDGIMEDVLTEERDVTPERRADVSDDQPQDP